MRRTTEAVFALVLLCATPASAATFAITESSRGEFPLSPSGLVVIDNPFGNVEVVGVEGARTVSWTAQKVVRGADDGAIAEGSKLTDLQTTGDASKRLIKTEVPLLHSQRWQTTVNYSVRVPRGAQVKIVANSSDRLRVTGTSGSVTVRNWNGPVFIENVTGAVGVDSLNGDVFFSLVTQPTADLQLSTVNGHIELTVPPESLFRWNATTLKGDFLSTMPVSGRFNGTRYVAAVNGARRGPQITTTSMTGNIFILKRGTRPEQALSARVIARNAGPMTSASPAPAPAQTFQRSVVEGDFVFSTFGNVSVGNILGSAKVETRAGEVQLGIVRGRCDIVSLGGPVTLGDVFGPLTARTSAGDITVNAARQGAIVATGGGMIKMLWANGMTNLRSEGGDIVVSQASGPVTAETVSGDIHVAVDRSLRSSLLDLKTSQGNIVLSLNPPFGAEIDAVVITSDSDTNPIHSDFNGLTVRREQVDGRTRIRATGKINGGGDRVTLYAEEGDIHIVNGAPPELFGTPP